MAVRFDPKQNNILANKIRVFLLLFLSIASVSTLFVLTSHRFLQANPTSAEPASHNEQTGKRVTALGYLTPQGNIIHLSAPAGNQRLMELRVKEGDRVKAGQILAVMDNLDKYQATVESARAKVNVTQARLVQVQAGEKLGAIEAQRRQIAELEAQVAGDVADQQGVIARQEVELNRTEADYRRYLNLSKDGVVAKATAENARLQAQIEQRKLQDTRARLSAIQSTGEERIRGARATLDSLTNVQPTSISVAQAERDEAISQLRKSEVELESVYVRSPVAGQILRLNTNVGEIVGSSGPLDIGQTQQMYMVAEVYESDVQHIKPGQSATIVSNYGGLRGEVKGVVEQVGLQINKSGIGNDDPASDTDTRVVKVKIRLHPQDSQRVQSLNNLEVRATIQVD